MLLEKALAKLCGGYDRLITAGDTASVLRDITGGMVHRAGFDRDLPPALMLAGENGHTVLHGVSVGAAPGSSGLLPDVAYTVLSPPSLLRGLPA